MKTTCFKFSLLLIVITGLWACTLTSIRDGKPGGRDIPLNSGVRDASFLDDMEREIILELNAARTSPREYADFLRGLRGRAEWRQGLEDAILFVEREAPFPPLKASKGLSLAARELVRDRGPEGLTGHTGKDGRSMFDRMNNYGMWEDKAGEYLGYGYREAAALVARMAIEEASAGAEPKAYMFNRDFLVVGVACGPHKSYRVMCAVDFARVYREKPDLP